MSVPANIAQMVDTNTFQAWIDLTNETIDRSNRSLIDIGDVADLDTSVKSNTVAAINELKDEQFKVDYGSGNILAGDWNAGHRDSTDDTTDITGSHNTVYGANALAIAVGASNSTAYGSQTQNRMVSGVQNATFGSHSMRLNQGDDNVVMGFKAAETMTGGDNNVILGSEAMNVACSATEVVAIGYRAMQYAQSSEHVGIGGLALRDMVSGLRNVMVGYNAMSSGDGDDNVGLGHSVLYSAVGDRMTAVGSQAGLNATGNDCVFLGYSAGQSETGSAKLIIGNQIMDLITGDFSATVPQATVQGTLKCLNTDVTARSVARFLGTFTANPTGVDGDFYYNSADSSVRLYSSGAWHTYQTAAGSYMSYLGDQAALPGSGTAGDLLKYIPDYAASDYSNTGIAIYDGSDWMLLPLRSDTTGTAIILGRTSALEDTTGKVIAIGFDACDAWQTGVGEGVIGVGTGALDSHVEGPGPVAVGYGALAKGLENDYTVGLGYQAGYNANGASNIFIGKQAGKETTLTSVYNKIVIDNAQNSAKPWMTGNTITNVCNVNAWVHSNPMPTDGNFGMQPMPRYMGAYAASTTLSGKVVKGDMYWKTGAGMSVYDGSTFLEPTDLDYTTNIGLGSSALDSITTGVYNVALGHQAMETATTASNSVSLGYRAGVVATTGSNCISIGCYAGENNALGNHHKLAIGPHVSYMGTKHSLIEGDTSGDGVEGLYNSNGNRLKLYANTQAYGPIAMWKGSGDRYGVIAQPQTSYIDPLTVEPAPAGRFLGFVPYQGNALAELCVSNLDAICAGDSFAVATSSGDNPRIKMVTCILDASTSEYPDTGTYTSVTQNSSLFKDKGFWSSSGDLAKQMLPGYEVAKMNTGLDSINITYMEDNWGIIF